MSETTQLHYIFKSFKEFMHTFYNKSRHLQLIINMITFIWNSSLSICLFDFPQEKLFYQLLLYDH